VGLHLCDGATDSRKEGAGHNRVADIQFMQVRQRQDRLDIVVVDAMAGVHDESETTGLLAGELETGEFGFRGW